MYLHSECTRPRTRMHARASEHLAGRCSNVSGIVDSYSFEHSGEYWQAQVWKEVGQGQGWPPLWDKLALVLQDIFREALRSDRKSAVSAGGSRAQEGAHPLAPLPRAKAGSQERGRGVNRHRVPCDQSSATTRMLRDKRHVACTWASQGPVWPCPRTTGRTGAATSVFPKGTVARIPARAPLVEGRGQPTGGGGA